MCWYGIRFDRSKCLRVIIVFQDFTKMKLRYVFLRKRLFASCFANVRYCEFSFRVMWRTEMFYF